MQEAAKKTMTLEQVLDITIKLLGDISVPASMTEKIGIPVYQAIGNLKECVEAIKRQNAEREEAMDIPELEIVDEPTSDEESTEEGNA